MEDLLNLLSKKRITNQFPTTNAPYRLAVIGEAPGKDEEDEGTPFVGASGRLLTALLSDAGIDRDACFIGNVCQTRPPENDLSKFSWGGDEIQSGIRTLEADLSRFQPNLCLLLGNTALHVFKSTDEPKRKAGKYVFPNPISAWRGSLFNACGRITGYKCLAAYHPALLLRVYNESYPTRFDFRRARREAENPTLQLPERAVDISPSVEKICDWLLAIKSNKMAIAIDIEGSPSSIYCLSMAVSPTAVFIIPFCNMDGSSYWSPEDEARIWRALADVLTDPLIPKYLQNCLFDRFVFTYFGILVRGIVDDTMLLHWEHLCEMPKSLGFQTSFYTRQPHYKADIKDDDEDKNADYWTRKAKVPPEVFWNYCCLDSAVTFEIRNILRASVKNEGSLSHYSFNMSVLNPMLYMEMRGIKIDHEKKTFRILELKGEAEKRQELLNAAVGHELSVRSPKQVLEYLYKERQLPVQIKRGGTAPSADYESLLKLYKKTEDPVLMDIIRLREVLKRISDLESMRTDRDGRIRFSYNVVGSSTGRVSCSGSSTGAGCNGQTIVDANPIFLSNAMRAGCRDLLIADLGNYFWQCDLSGADGWSVAAHCARLGDPTMLDDLLAGIKIAKVIALIVKHGPSINKLPRKELKERTNEIKKDDHLYFSCKQVQHGSNYGMKPPTVALRVLLESYGEINIDNKTATQYQDAYLSRYRGILRWHDWVREQVRKGYLISASGHKRLITGRKESEDTLREILSHEPQHNTTYATNLAAVALWKDADNRRSIRLDGIPLLRNEPLHQVHDALCGQFRQEDTSWAVDKIKSYFDNEIVIAGQKIKIPFDGRYGMSWGELNEGTI